MKTVLVMRGLAKGRRQSIIDEIKEPYELEDFIQIDTPAPKEKLKREEIKALSIASFNSFQGAIALGKELIIINNMNTKKYHYKDYLEYAQQHSYLVGIIIVPWNDMSDRELSIDCKGEKPIGAFKKYRSEFEWGL